MANKPPKKRNGFYYINNREYPSVTKILSVIDKPALKYWLMRETARLALRNPELSEKEVIAEMQRANKTVTGRGQYVHDYVAQTLGKVDYPIVDLDYGGYINAYRSWKDSYEPVVMLSEEEVHSERFGYAGRIDCVCKLKEEVWLLDFKTGKAIYPEVGLQLAAYREALPLTIDHTGVVLFMDSGEYQTMETKATLEDFLNVKRVWEWSQRKGG